MTQEPTQNEIEAMIHQAAFNGLIRDLHKVEEEFGIAGAVAAALGYTAAMTQWSEDVFGMSLESALQVQKRG